MTKTVPQDIQQQIRAQYRALLAAQGGTPRKGQQAMIAAVARAVANERQDGEGAAAASFAAIEARTGSGKTYAYCLGAIPQALRNERRVIISVSTVALQEQLVFRDLPAVAGVIPGMNVALVKGRARFICGLRAAEIAESSGTQAEEAARLLWRLDQGEWTGDVDDLGADEKPGFWTLMTNDRNGCAGQRCGRFDTCPYYAARRAAAAANVVVTNHDLLMGDVAAGNVILPQLADSVIVVDEAHRLPESALASLSAGHALRDTQKWTESAMALMARLRAAGKTSALAKRASSSREAIERMEAAHLTAAEQFERACARMAAGKDGKTVRFAGGVLPDALCATASECLGAAEAARDSLEQIGDALRGEEGESLVDAVRERLLSETGRLLGSVERIRALWRLMSDAGDGGEPVAKWIEVKDGDLSIHASPTAVGRYLFDALWSKVRASVHLSATLRSVNDFAPYLSESGLAHAGDVPTLMVEGGFDYANRATLVVPKECPNAKDENAHTQYLIETLPALLGGMRCGAGALVLFSSWAQLRAVRDGMPAWVTARLLSQDELSRRELLDRHGAAIAVGRSSWIFASAGMEEGVDLRGAACELVVIAKLPFASPTDPVSQTLREHIEGLGRSHFEEIVLPRAFRRLAQATGRLLRSEKDAGTIVVADSRLRATRYGRAMVAALPPYRLSVEM